jgi:hypothetical protein
MNKHQPDTISRIYNPGILLNRDYKLPADSWYQVTRVAEVPNQRLSANGDIENIVQVLDNTSADAMVQRFNAQKTAAGENFAGLLVDYDHFSWDSDQKSEAAGWATDLANRNGELWAQIRWTTHGRADVEGGNYRFLSGSWLLSDSEDLGQNRFRPLRLDRIAVTNDPRIKNMKPLSNREEGNQQEGDKTMDLKSQITTLFALPAGSVDAEIVTALNNAKVQIDEHSALKNRVADLEAENTALKNSNTALLETQVAADLEQYKDIIADPVAMKAQLLNNRENALALLKSVKPAKAVPPSPLHNRAAAGTPELTTQESASKQRAAVEKYRADHNCSFERAWAACRAAQPELFAQTQD